MTALPHPFPAHEIRDVHEESDVRRASDRHEKLVLTPEVFAVGPVRRALDVLVSAVLLVPALVVLGVASALILLTDGRPVLFTQSRIGQGGRPFRIYKLRTMRAGAGPEVTATCDGRITAVGRLLRRTSVDELPQLWHVLRGQMTLVGPRPESRELAARYPASCRAVLLARPGLTGPAQLRYRERSAVPPAGWGEVEAWYLTVLVPLRTDADLEFLLRPTLRTTLAYLALTARFVVGLADPQAPVTAIGPSTNRSDAQAP
jgi:lipopolysaccharide/colanic/teichoic acid biosynthesis glycosyltransferase